MPNSDHDIWTAVDEYIVSTLHQDERETEAALASSEAEGLPAIAVSPPHGKLLFLLASMVRAERILEIGTLGGFSAIWLARALSSDGKLVTLELEQHHADVARAALVAAGQASKVDIRVGPAQDTLKTMVTQREAAFDFIFIDADKEGYPAYLEAVLDLSRPGTVIVADNTVRDGAVADGHSTDPSVQAVRRYNAMVAADPRLTGTSIQTVGAKGYDGFTIAVRGE